MADHDLAKRGLTLDDVQPIAKREDIQGRAFGRDLREEADIDVDLAEVDDMEEIDDEEHDLLDERTFRVEDHDESDL